MNNGDDTDFYLKKGFKVVAVEANGRLCEDRRRPGRSPHSYTRKPTRPEHVTADEMALLKI